MNFLTLVLKEWRETLRDRRTLITLLAMPLLTYPLLGLVFQKFLLSQLQADEPVAYHVVVLTGADYSDLRSLLETGQQLLFPDETNRPALQMILQVAGDDPSEELLEDHLRQRISDLIVRSRGRDANQGIARWELLYDPHSSLSRKAWEYVDRRIAIVIEAELRQRVRQADSARPLPPVRVSREIESGKTQTMYLAALIPMILILMTVTGAVYPAIDLTAGERERGTLEALMAAPIAKGRVLLAKYIAVLTVSLLTAIVNLLAMFTTVWSLGLEEMLFGGGPVSWHLLPAGAAVLGLFAAFFSACLLAVTSVSRSFKEAQASLIPLMLCSLTPGIITMMPGTRLTFSTAFVPVLNLSLLARDTFDGSVDGLGVLIVVLATAVYTLLALGIAARLFGSDAVLYGSAGSWVDLGRRPEQPQADVPFATACWTLAVCVALFVPLGMTLGRLPELSLTQRLLANAAVIFTICSLLPGGVMAWQRIRFTGAWGKGTGSFLALAGGVLLGVSIWAPAVELEFQFQSGARLAELMERFTTLRMELRETSLVWKLFALALVPAVCEEFFFRGFLLSGLRRVNRDWIAILIAGAIFGAFHILVRDLLLWERFLPAAALGVLLGWIRVRSDSLLPGMVLHTLHNGLLLTIGHYEIWLQQQGWGTEQAVHVPPLWLLTFAGISAIGVGLIACQPRQRPQRG